MRLDTSPPGSPASWSTPPLGTSQSELLDMHRLQVEDRGRRRTEDPAARLARVQHQGLAVPPDLEPMRPAVDDDRVPLDRPGGDVTDIVHEQHALPFQLDRVRRLVQLGANPGAGRRLE